MVVALCGQAGAGRGQRLTLPTRQEPQGLDKSSKKGGSSSLPLPLCLRGTAAQSPHQPRPPSQSTSAQQDPFLCLRPPPLPALKPNLHCPNSCLLPVGQKPAARAPPGARAAPHPSPRGIVAPSLWKELLLGRVGGSTVGLWREATARHWGLLNHQNETQSISRNNSGPENAATTASPARGVKYSWGLFP